jgi:hypothetical protein
MTRGVFGRAAALVLVVGLGPACEQAHPAEPTEHAAPPRSREDDDRDQYRLASLVDDARRDDQDTAARTLERVRQSWLHTRIHWEVGYAPAFCRDAGPCMALPFDHGRLRATLPQGWLPELALDAHARAELRRCCAAVHGQCVFDFHGTFARFELGRDRPTSLSFRDVEVGGCRSARIEESWVRRSPRAKSTDASDPHVALSRTGPREG